MKRNEFKSLNLLGHKRNNDYQILNGEKKIDSEEKANENKKKISHLKKHEFDTAVIEEKNNINLEERDETRMDNNINIKTENIIHKNICQRCNSGNNILIFNSYKSVLDFSSKNKITIVTNFLIDENINFDSPKMICLNCLLTISKNRIEFIKFFLSNNSQRNDINNNPFDNLLHYPNLKNFNNIENRKKKSQNQNDFDNKLRNILKKLNAKLSLLLNDSQKNNNILNNPKINFDFLNILNYFPSPSIGYNKPFNLNTLNINYKYP